LTAAPQPSASKFSRNTSTSGAYSGRNSPPTMAVVLSANGLSHLLDDVLTRCRAPQHGRGGPARRCSGEWARPLSPAARRPICAPEPVTSPPGGPMRLSRPLAVLTAMAVGSVGLLVVGLGSFLDVSRAQPPAQPHLVAVAPAAPGTAITGRLVDPDGRPADNVEVQALPVGGGAPVASAISYGGRFELLVPTGTWRVVGTDLTHPARFAPLTAGTVEVGAGAVRRLG